MGAQEFRHKLKALINKEIFFGSYGLEEGGGSIKVVKCCKILYKFWLCPMFVILGYISLYRLFSVAYDIKFSFCF